MCGSVYPMTLYLAARLSKPAILTRGYRGSPRRYISALSAGPTAWSETGDEAQILFLSIGLGPVRPSARVRQGRRVVPNPTNAIRVEHFILGRRFSSLASSTGQLTSSGGSLAPCPSDPFPMTRLRSQCHRWRWRIFSSLTKITGRRP